MNAHTPFDANQDWTNPYCQNSSNDPMVDALLGNAYHVVRTVYCNLGNLKLIYDFLNQYGMVLGVQSEAELKALTTKASFARIYDKTPAGDRQVTDYLYVEGDRTGILPDDTTATGSWVKVATTGSDNGGDKSNDGGYIPWIYNSGSANGGETTIRIPDETAGAPFMIVNGDWQTEGYDFEYDPVTYEIKFSTPLEPGDFVVVMRTGVPATPDNPNVSDWVTINWLYKQGAAVGGEQVIDIPYTFQSVPAVYKNGLRFYKGLTNNSYTIDSDNNRIILTEPLVTNDRLIVQLGGEAKVLEIVDHTIQEVARAANVKDSEVILSTDTTQVLNGKKVIYDVVTQHIYGLPTLPTNVYISTVSGGHLTYNPGGVVVDLLPAPDSNALVYQELAKPDGSKLVGDCASLAQLRTIEPTVNKQRIYVREHTAGIGIGGGTFIYDSTDTSSADDDGYIVVTAGGKRWVRDCLFVESDHYGLVPGAVVDVAPQLNKAYQAAKKTKYNRLVLAKGSFYVNAALKHPSDITISGSGNYASAIIALPTMPITENVIQNEKYSYKVFGTDYDENIRIENLIVDANNRARNTTETWVDATQGTTIMLTTTRKSVLDRVWIRRSIQHGLDIAAGYYFNNGNINHNAVGGSYDIVVKDCLGQNSQLDDVLTMHNSSKVKFIRCDVWNDDPDMVWAGNQHGIEIDEGSKDVVVRDCRATNFITGFQQKGHDETMPARNVIFDNCIAENCVYSFQIEHRNPATITPGQVQNARSSRIINCTSINANNTKYSSLHARAIHIDGFYGVYIDNFRIEGGSGNIYLMRGAKGVYMDGIFVDGGYTGATSSTSEGIIHIETGAGCDNYHISNVSVVDAVSVPVVRDLTDTLVNRTIENIYAVGSDATIPMLAIVPNAGDNIKGLVAGGSWACVLRDMARGLGNGDYLPTVSFTSGVSTQSGSGNPNNGTTCGKAGALYIDVGTGGVAGDRYHCTDVGVNHWVKVTTA